MLTKYESAQNKQNGENKKPNKKMDELANLNYII